MKVKSFEIKGRDVLKLRALPGLHDYDKDSKMVDKKGTPLQYRRFTFDGKCFIAQAEDMFCKAFDDNLLYSANFIEDDQEQYALVGYTNINQEVNMAKTEATLKSYTVALSGVALDEETVEALKEE